MSRVKAAGATGREEYPPRPRRDAVDALAMIQVLAGPGAVARIENVSAEGLGARCSQSLPIGAQVIVELAEHGLFSAQIRWALGGRVGLSLDGACDLRERRLSVHERTELDASPDPTRDRVLGAHGSTESATSR